MNTNSLVPKEFAVPESLQTSEFKLRMLTIHDVVKDYDAVMTSIDHLQGIFGAYSSWPSAELSLEQDLIDLGWHQKEFQRRSSFAYTVVTTDETRCLGCMYIYPSSSEGYDADVYYWARQSEISSGLEERLFETITNWLQTSWPFTAINFPGRDADSGMRK